MSEKMDDQWSRMRAILRGEFGESAFDQWIKVLTLEGFDKPCVEICAPTASIGSWVRANYLSRMRQLWREMNPDVREVRVLSDGELDLPPTEREAIRFAPSLSAVANREWRFESFISGSSNAMAFSVARSLPERTEAARPLYIYGDVGLGKTHLLHAIANEFGQNHRSHKVLLLSSEKFMQSFVSALRCKTVESFKECCRGVDILLLDDVHFVAGRVKTQEELLHTFDALLEAGKPIVLTADRAPSDLREVCPRLVSRFGGGTCCEVRRPTHEMRLKILQAKALAQGLPLSGEVLAFIAEHIHASVRDLEGAINRVAVHARVTDRAVDLEVVQALLQDLLRQRQRRITIDEIQRKVCEHYNLKPIELNSERRSRNVARPRQIAMYLSKQLTNRSMPEIGRKFGGRDHTTVMHAIRRIDDLQRSDSEFGDELQLLRRVLET